MRQPDFAIGLDFELVLVIQLDRTTDLDPHYRSETALPLMCSDELASQFQISPPALAPKRFEIQVWASDSNVRIS